MNHGAVRKLMRAAAMSLLVLAATSGVAGFEVLAAGPAVALPGDPTPPTPDPNNPNPAPADPNNPNPAPADPSNPGGGLLGGVLPGGGSGGGSGSGSGGGLLG